MYRFNFFVAMFNIVFKLGHTFLIFLLFFPGKGTA